MRTTVRLDDGLLEQAKAAARQRHRTVTSLIEEGLRLVLTNPRIFVRPSRAADVIAFADALLDQPHCRIVQPGDRHWTIFRHLCKAANASGNLVQDAWLAALAIEHGCEWITRDSGFAKFPGLRWRSIEAKES